MSFKIPEKNGELLCMPPPALIPQLIKSNKERFKAYDFYIEKIHVHDFRKKVREQVLKISQQYTSALALTPPAPAFSKGEEIIMTGHQPIFYHPGILVKNLLLNKIGREENITAVNLIVDTDSFKEITVNIPAYNNGNKINRETFLSNPSPIPYELSSAPSWDTFKLFSKKIENHISHPHFNNLHENFSKLIKRVWGEKKDFKTLSEFMTFVRRKYEDEIESQYLEAPLSKICDTDEFLMFFISILRESETFASIYNYHLGHYRREHKLRYPANPFPDLRMNGKKIELPFWYFNKKKRFSVSTESSGNGINLSFDDIGDISFKRDEMDKGIELLKNSNIKIRPKAIILTLFNRLFVSDVFIHGVGGAKYDRITDGIIQDFYKVEPPDFITASLTLYPSFHFFKENQHDKIKDLDRKLRDMRYNPERYIEDKQKVDNILDGKKSLLSIIKEKNVNKKDISMQLKGINDRLYQIIKPAANEIEEKIKALTKQQQEIEAIQRRDYPYFLFSPDEIIKRLS